MDVHTLEAHISAHSFTFLNTLQYANVAELGGLAMLSLDRLRHIMVRCSLCVQCLIAARAHPLPCAAAA
jgi:hypothetical protein